MHNIQSRLKEKKKYAYLFWLNVDLEQMFPVIIIIIIICSRSTTRGHASPKPLHHLFRLRA